MLENTSLFFWKCYRHISITDHWSIFFYNLMRGSFHTWPHGNAIMRQKEVKFITTSTSQKKLKYSTLIQSVQNLYFQKHIISWGMWAVWGFAINGPFLGKHHHYVFITLGIPKWVFFYLDCHNKFLKFQHWET